MPKKQANIKQDKIDAWYDNFIQQVSQPPFNINPNLPEDIGRIYEVLNTPNAKGAEMAPPLTTGETLYDKRNKLYELASSAKLYVFPLAEYDRCSQIRVEPADKLLYDLKSEVLNQPMPPKPQEQKLGFFKSILNALFGAFEEERVQLLTQFIEAGHKYNNYAKAYNCNNIELKTITKEREDNMLKHQEYARSVAPDTINELEERLNDKNLLPWQKEAYEAKLTLFTALRDGQTLTTEQCEDIITKSIVGRMGDYKIGGEYKGTKTTPLQELLHQQPEKAIELKEIIKNAPGVKELAVQGKHTVVKYTFTSVSLDQTMNIVFNSLKESNEQMQKYVENLKKMMKTNSAPAPQKTELHETKTANHGLGAM